MDATDIAGQKKKYYLHFLNKGNFWQGFKQSI